MTPEDIPGGPSGQPEKWTWRDRARGSVVSATVLDPGTEPLDGIEAFQTAYVPDRLLLSDGVDIVWRESGWRDLAGELRADSIGGEMLEMEVAP